MDRRRRLRRTMKSLARGSTVGAFAWLVAISPVWIPLEALALIAASPDITIDWVPGGGADLVSDQDVGVDNELGIVVEETLGNVIESQIPLDLVGYHDEGADRLLVSTTTVALGGTVASPGDVVRFDGATYDVIFDASVEGIPFGVELDAVTRGVDGELIFSTDTSVDFGAFVSADEDLVRFDGTDFTRIFDGSAHGVSGELDIDGASIDSTGLLFLSFDTGGEIAGVTFADEDVLEFDLETSTWASSLRFDASVDASGGFPERWAPADLDALQVPEPGFMMGLGLGFGWLAMACCRRGAS